MRKILIRTLAVFLALVMASLMSLQIFAAGEKLYISDLMIASGASVAAAKKKLTSKGYSVILSNLNEGNDGVVLVGYMTTKNKDEAITDISVMSMDNGYSYENYAHVLEEYQETADKLVGELETAVNEYRENYKAGKYCAVLANILLNRFYDTDFGETDNLLGDILAREDLTKNQLSVIFMQASALAVNTIEVCLAIGCYDNWIDRFINMPENTQYDAADDDKARTIFKSFSGFQSEMKQYEDIINACTLTADSSEEEWTAYYNSLSESDQGIVSNYANTYDYLKSTAYKNGTLYDFFMQDLDEIDNTDLYPLARAMTDGQIATVNYASLCTAIQYATFNDNVMKSMISGAEEQNSLEKVSVFEGIDRTIFDADGIALTSEAIRQSTSSSDCSWYRGGLSTKTKNIFYSIIGTAAGIGAIGIGAIVLTSVKVKAVISAAYQTGLANVGLMDVETMMAMAEVGMDEFTITGIQETALAAARHSSIQAGANSTWAAAAGVAKIVTAVALAIAFITLVIYLVAEYKSHNQRQDYSDIPRIIVDQTTAEDGTRSYTYYYAVTDTAGAYADLNNWKGSRWNALYYTKDTDAGEPILLSGLVQTSNLSSDSAYNMPVHEFGSEAAYNLNRFSSSQESGIYLFFQADDTTELAGTAMTYGIYSLVAVAGIAVGAAGMFAFDRFLLKKKKENLA